MPLCSSVPREGDGRIDQYIIIIINLTPFELKAMRVSYKSLKLGKTLLFA